MKQLRAGGSRAFDGAGPHFGVPTVMVHTDMFVRVVRSTVRTNGMPRMRAAFVPQSVMGKTPRELRADVDGLDPVTGRPFMQEVIEELTTPVAGEDLAGETFERTTPRFVEPDSEENLHELFLANHWTDTLPIVLPTEKRVARMLAGTSHRPDEILGACGRPATAKRGRSTWRRSR